MIKKKKNILYFAVQFYPENTGYSFAATNFIKSIADNYDITVMTPVKLPAGTKEMENIAVIRGSKKGLLKFLYQFIILVPVLVKLRKYDVIFFDTAELFFLGNIVSRFASKKTIIRFHGCMTTEAAYYSKTLMMRIWKYFIRKWVKKTKVITSTTEYYNNFVKQLYLKNNPYLYGTKNFSVIPNTLFTADYKLPSSTEIYEKYSIDSNKFNLLTLGRMDKDGLIQKGIEDLIFSLKLFKKQYENFSLTIIGSGNKQDHLINLVKSLNLHTEIKFIDKAPHLDILALSKYLDATVLYSRFEGMSMFALEAVSFGCFPIFSDVGGLKDLVINGKSGFLVEPQNIFKLAETFNRRIKMTSDEADIFRSRGIAHFQESFIPKNVSEKFDETLNYILLKGNK